MPKTIKTTKKAQRASAVVKSEERSLFRELMAGVEAVRRHREGRLTLRSAEAPSSVSSP